MVSPPKSMRRVGRAARTGLVGGIVAALACFDALLLGMPIAALASVLRPSFVFITAAVAVSFLSIACCTWVDRRWDESSSRNAMRVERRLAQMRSSRLMAHPVAWIQRGSDRWYALAAALANPILIAALARPMSGRPIGRRRILLGSVAYAIPYAALWSVVGLILGDVIGGA